MTTPGQPGWPGGQPPYGQQPYGQQPYGQPGVPLYGQPAMPAGPRPRPVTASMWLMILGGAITFLGFVIQLALEYDTIRDDFIADVTTGSDGMSVDSAETTFLVVIVGVGVVALLFSLLWVLFGYLVGQGKNWARITATVLGVIGGVCGLCGLASLVGDTTSAASSVVTFVASVIGVASIILLWIPDANRWFAAKDAERI